MNRSYFASVPHVTFINTTPFWGGGERSHLEKAVALRRRGHRVSVVAHPGGRLLARAAAAGLETFPLALGKLSPLNPLAHLRLGRYLRRVRPEAVVLNASADLKVGAPAARSAGVRRIVYLRGLDVPIKNTPLNRYLIGRRVTRVIANSEATRRTVLERLPLPAEKVAVVYHGIDLSGGPPPPPSSGGDGPVVIGSAGRLTAQKAQHELIAAAAVLRKRGLNFELRIAGEGELGGLLQREIARLDLGAHVRLLGFVDDMDDFYDGLDVFALTSHWEGYGFVLVEAMRRGLPVVAYDVSSNPEIVAAGVTGHLVPVGDVEAFAERLATLSADPDRRRALGAAGWARVQACFELERQLDAFAALVLGNHA